MERIGDYRFVYQEESCDEYREKGMKEKEMSTYIRARGRLTKEPARSWILL